MNRFVIQKHVSSYTLSTECDSSNLAEVVKNMEEMAKKVKSLVQEPLTKDGIGDEAVPSIAGSQTTSEGILRLFNSDWGSHPRSMREILEALNANGVFMPTTTLSSVLFHLIKKGRLQRWKSGKSYVYQRGQNE